MTLPPYRVVYSCTMDVTLKSAVRGILLAIVMGIASNYGRTVTDSDVLERIERLEIMCGRGVRLP